MKIRGIRILAVLEDGTETVLWKKTAETSEETLTVIAAPQSRGLEKVAVTYIGPQKSCEEAWRGVVAVPQADVPWPPSGLVE